MNIGTTAVVVIGEFVAGAIVGYRVHKLASEEQQKKTERNRLIAGVVAGYEMTRRAMYDKATTFESKIMIDRAFWPMIREYEDSHPGEAVRHAHDLYVGEFLGK